MPTATKRRPAASDDHRTKKKAVEPKRRDVAVKNKPQVRARTRKLFAREDPDDEELPVPKKAPAKTLRAAAKQVPNAKPRKVRAADDDLADEIDAQDDGLGHFEMEGISQHSRRTLELEVQMQARLRNEPIFPYPPEMLPTLRPYWVELVNSFPRDHFRVSDITMMKMYCQCAYDIDRQTVKIEEEGEVVIGGRGQAIVNPRCKVRDKNRETLLTLATKFRNQPASRQNTANFGRNQRKSQVAGEAAQTLADDEDGLLARPGDEDFDDLEPPNRTRH